VAAHFELAILTPERSLFEGRVEYVEVPGVEGGLGVLAHHAALVTPLGAGVLTVRLPDGEELRWRVSGGFFEVGEDRATVLADEAGPAPE
jgi:F-type H+-transporting ATPase subunit epsilon